MKKTIASIIIILLVVAAAIYVLWPYFTPDASKGTLDITPDGKGKIYVTERHAESSYIYRTDSDGNIDAAIEIDDSVYGTNFMGGMIYAFVYHEKTHTWSLAQVEADLSESREVGSGKFSLLGSEQSLSSSADRVFLMGNGSDAKHLIVLSYSPTGQFSLADDFEAAEAAGVKGMSVYMETALNSDNTPKNFVFDGKSIFEIQGDEKIAVIKDGGVVTSDERYPDSRIYCRGGRVFILNNTTHEISTVTKFPETELNYTYDNLDVGATTVWDGGGALLAKNSKGNMNIYFAKSGSTNSWEPITDFNISLSVRLQLKDFMPQKIWIIVIVLSLAFIASVMVAMYVRRLVLRVCATISVLGCFMLAVLCSLVWILMNKIILTEVNLATGGVMHEYVAPEAAQAEVAFEAFTYGGIALLVAIAIAVFFTNWSLRPLRDLTRRIGRFIEGDFAVDGAVTDKGDLGRMSRAVTEMGVSLAIKQYETDRMVESYSRFVPRDADRLLERAGIMEVSTGDVSNIDECIAIASVENRERVMHSMGSNEFMTFVNSCFARILECSNKYSGALLSGEFLAALPILFSERLGAKRGDSVRFGLDLIDHMTDKDSDLPSPDFFMLLHKTDFLYGIAGTKEKAFPFISSAELNFLFACNSGLRKLGIRMAATQEYIDNSEQDETFAKRYIGLIQAPAATREYRVYEILDCLSDRERDLRLGYDEKVQNAISLFYRNDFYQAMVEFSSILKQNPNDGLVRWYAFACERYFNEGAAANVRYNLLNGEDD
ncbi:MAG: hypothetical protein LBN34_02750 [Clostridiales Family XIII bacterium]|nr:hypothetical protein [Clostridiales Family XIII bacterium]